MGRRLGRMLEEGRRVINETWGGEEERRIFDQCNRQCNLAHQACTHSNIRMFKHSNIQAFRGSKCQAHNIFDQCNRQCSLAHQACTHSNTQASQHSNVRMLGEFKHSNIQTFKRSKCQAWAAVPRGGDAHRDGNEGMERVVFGCKERKKYIYIYIYR